MTIEPPSLNFTSANAAAIKMFGAADSAEFLSLSVGELSPPRQPDGTPTPQKMEETLQIVLQEGSHFFEWAHCRRNGEVFPATVLLTKLHFGDRTIIQATVRDITERKETERKLEEVNAKLTELSMTDQLTGLPNRRQLDQKINEEITRSKRTGKGLAVLMLDLDHFKQVNDQYGHQKGDEILQQFAEILRQEVRDMDLPTRFGGEEFCVLLPEIEADEGRNVAERIRAAAELLSDPAPTVSVGVGYWEADMSSGGVLRRADRALYAAKEAGRNCVVTYCKQPGKGAQNLSDSE